MVLVEKNKFIFQKKETITWEKLFGWDDSLVLTFCETESGTAVPRHMHTFMVKQKSVQHWPERRGGLPGSGRGCIEVQELCCCSGE